MARSPEASSRRRRGVPQAALLSGLRWRRTVRWLGLAIFVVGAVLLGYVFTEALHGFQRFAQSDYLAAQLNRVSSKDPAAVIIAGVSAFGGELLRVLYLLLLGYLASVIASKGIQFFAAADSVIDEAVASGLAEDDMDAEAELSVG